MRSWFVKAAIFATLVGCDNPVTPSPPPPVSTTTIPAPPPFNPGPMFSYDNVRGVLLFAGTQGSEGELRTLIGHIRTQWRNKSLAFNVCTETAEWESTPWADGEAPFSKENLENLRRFLKITAEEHVFVRLNIFCTVRDNHGWMNARAEEYVHTVVGIVLPYNHVLLSVGNEPWHPSSWLRSNNRVRQVRDWIREAGWQGEIGADDNIGCAGCSFEYSYRNLGMRPDFHPYRNPDPNQNALNRIYEINGPSIISEPTAYSSWSDGTCCTSDQQQIITYMRRAERAGHVWFFHSTSGLNWPREAFEWLPPQ